MGVELLPHFNKKFLFFYSWPTKAKDPSLTYYLQMYTFPKDQSAGVVDYADCISAEG